MDHPIQLVPDDDLQRNRLTVFLRPLLAVPHLVWLSLWGFLVAIALLAAWIAALARGRVPAGLHAFLERYLRYQVHAYAYVLLAADAFPAFAGEEGSYPVDLRVAPPQEQSRATVLVRIVLALPALVLSSLLDYLSGIVAFFAWFACLARGRMPDGMQRLQLLCIRYHAQTQGYAYLLTQRYPSLNPESR